jgi:CDP-diacylglycerol--glycerol-3-phosphate 3-phosphatidyltransferase
MFDGRWRSGVDRGTQPIGSALHRTGITANQLTAAGLAISFGAAALVATGHLILGLIALVAAALPDLLDGPLAKAAGTTGPRGAFFDSVSDRVTDSAVLGGLAWYLQSSRGGHAGLLALAVLGASALVSYERAKAESLGFVAKGGIMERAERIIVLCVGLAFPVLVPALWVLLAGSLFTAVQRFVKVWRQASVVQTTAPPEPAISVEDTAATRWTRAAMEARWRARRETWRPAGARWLSSSSQTGTWRTRRQARLDSAGRHDRRSGRHRGAGTRP